MTDEANKEDMPERESLGVLAEYRSPHELVNAAKSLREDGFTEMEAFSPFPVHGIDEALGIKGSRLPWMVLTSGVFGGAVALWFQWWTNTIDYPYIISGKPFFSLPANIPVTFEFTILMSAFAAFFGMLLLNGLPRLANPLLANERFRKVTDDGFFLLIKPADKEHASSVASVVRDRTSASSVEELTFEKKSERLPRYVGMAAAVLVSAALLPPLMVAKARATTSDKPRFHNFFNMDFQPKFKSQTDSTLFADGRAMRPRVEGTMPRGGLELDSRFYFGVEESDGLLHTVKQVGQQLDGSAESDLQPNYVKTVPVPVDEEMLSRGRTQFNIHCSACHGKAGYGNGLVSQRAIELEQGTWVPPTSLHSPHLLDQPDGQIFNSITNGVRKMSAYGHQVPPEDRWAIIAYIRALQRSQNASLEDVPEDYRQKLREFN